MQDRRFYKKLSAGAVIAFVEILLIGFYFGLYGDISNSFIWQRFGAVEIPTDGNPPAELSINATTEENNSSSLESVQDGVISERDRVVEIKSGIVTDKPQVTRLSKKEPETTNQWETTTTTAKPKMQTSQGDSTELNNSPETFVEDANSGTHEMPERNLGNVTDKPQVTQSGKPSLLEVSSKHQEPETSNHWETVQTTGEPYVEQISYFDANKVAKRIEYGSEREYHQRIQQAETLKEALIKDFIEPASLVVQNIENPLFLEYRCDSEIGICGGFGDRIRGMVSCFYLAFASRRVFHVNCIRNSELNQYFQLNSEFYNISKELYMEKVPDQNFTANGTVSYMDGGEEPTFLNWTKDPNWPGESSMNARLISILTNSQAGLEGVLKNPNYGDLFSTLTTNIHAESIDLSIFVSAALRIIFSKPVDRMSEAFEHCIVSPIGQDLWEHSIKIGIQMRTVRDGGYINPDHFNCFVNKTMSLIDDLNTNQTVVVFLTTDNENATDSVMTGLSSNNVIVLTGTEICDQLQIVHIDQQTDDDWWFSAKAYLDWYTLTKMDYLVMSRSGYSETAAYYSLRPSYRFNNKKTSTTDTCEFEPFGLIGDHVHME